MKDFNNTEDHPIPEGLEFHESYMQDAFAMYDAEKHKRKRRLLIWWIFSSAGFAAVVLAGIYFFTDGLHAGRAQKQQTVENHVSAGREPHTATHAVIASNSTKDIKKSFTKGEKRRNITGSEPGNLSAGIRSTENSKTKSKPGKRSGNKSTGDRTSVIRGTLVHAGLLVPNDTATKQTGQIANTSPKSGSAEKMIRDSLLPSDFPALALKPAHLAFTRDTAIEMIYPMRQPHQANTDFNKHQVFISLGVNTLFGMKELQNRVTFRESLGISYGYRINTKLSAEAGLEYYSISRISYTRTVGDTTDSDNTTTILNKTTLNYISLLPQLSYQLGAKHQVTAGLGFEYLLKDPGERYEIRNYTSESNSRTNSKLYYSNFNRLNFSASFGYSYQISRFMSAQAVYHFGFTDITKNNTFINNFDRNSRLQLKVKIKLN